MQEVQEQEGRGILGMRCEKKTSSFICTPRSINASFRFRSPFVLQASLVRESENMVRDTTTRLERATGELEDLIVRATPSQPGPRLYDPTDACDIRNPLNGMRNWSRIRRYAMLRLSLRRSVVLDDSWWGTNV